MAFFLESASLEWVQWLLPGSAVLFTALMFPTIFYVSFRTRCATCIVIVACSAASFRKHNISSHIFSYFMGFGAVWIIIWSAVLLIFKTPQKDFKRITRIRDPNSQSLHYVWEPYPESLSRRVFWVLDLMFNPRAVGWSHQRRPQPVLQRLYSQVKDGRAVRNLGPTTGGWTLSKNSHPHDRTEVVSSKRAFLVDQIFRLIRDYILVDISSYAMTQDTFLNGSDEFLRFHLPRDRILIWLRWLPYRMGISAIGCYAVIDCFFAITALIGVGIGTLGGRLLGTWSETWMYPCPWGSAYELYEKGLAGFWGICWHDIFAFGFQAFSFGLIPVAAKPSQSPPTVSLRRFLRIQLVFVLSGLMHMAGSYVQPLPTYPFFTFLAFFLQGIGICVQKVIERKLGKLGVVGETKKIFVFIFTLLWSYGSTPFVLGDMASGGLFRTKFLPCSFTGWFMGNPWPGWRST